MERIFIRLQSWARPLNLVIVFIVYLAVAMGIMQSGAAHIQSLSTQPLEILDLQFGFTVDEAVSILSHYSEESRLAAARFLLWADTLYPLVYGVFLTMLLAAVIRKGQVRYLVLLPMLAVMVDFGENYFLYRVLTQYPDFYFGDLSAASMFNATKWSLLALSGVSLLSGVVIRIFRVLPNVR